MTTRHQIRTERAPAPAHTFSQGVRHRPLLQVSGQGPVDAATGEYLHPGDVGAQTALTLANVGAVLAAGGGSWDEVVMVRVYLARQEDFATMNEAYGAFLSEAVSDVLPARTTVVVGLPRPEMLVEIDAMAVIDG